MIYSIFNHCRAKILKVNCANQQKIKKIKYIDGFILACLKANKDEFIEHANKADAVFMEQGATRILECWQDNVLKGQTTDFFGAVKAKNDEAVLFSWIEWPDKATRNAAMEKWKR